MLITAAQAGSGPADGLRLKRHPQIKEFDMLLMLATQLVPPKAKKYDLLPLSGAPGGKSVPFEPKTLATNRASSRWVGNKSYFFTLGYHLGLQTWLPNI